MNEHYIVIKLISDEQLMATFVNENENTIEIKNALSIKRIIVNNGERQFEHNALTTFCPFTNERNFVLNKSIIIYVKKLSDDLIGMYEDFIEAEFKTHIDVDDLVSKISNIPNKIKDSGIFIENYEDERLIPLFVDGPKTLQ